MLGATLTMLGIFGITIAMAPTESSRGLAAVNSWIAGSLACLFAYLIIGMMRHDLHNHYIAIYQAFIAGQVAIASSAFDTTPWQAGIIGMIIGLIFVIFLMLFRAMKIDDSMNVGATFGAPAFFGGFLPGLITNSNGVFWMEESGHTLAAQVVGVFVIMLWAIVLGMIVFGVLKALKMLRLDDYLQKETLEGAEMGVSGYKPKDTRGRIENAE